MGDMQAMVGAAGAGAGAHQPGPPRPKVAEDMRSITISDWVSLWGEARSSWMPFIPLPTGPRKDTRGLGVRSTPSSSITCQTAQGRDCELCTPLHAGCGQASIKAAWC
jgi:hypothetical protein